MTDAMGARARRERERIGGLRALVAGEDEYDVPQATAHQHAGGLDQDMLAVGGIEEHARRMVNLAA